MKQLSYQDLSIFCEQISMMNRSGILLHSGMQMIADDTSNSHKKAIYQNLANKLAAGEMLDIALKSSSVFPEYMVHLVEIGIKSGKLDTVMDGLSAYYNRQQMMRQNIKSAVVYPIVLIAMMLIVLVFLAYKVLPVFEQVFNSLGAQMSPWATYIMNIGSLFGRYSIFLAVLLFVVLIAILVFTRTDSGKAAFTNFFTGKKISEKFALSTFASSMSLMLSSGLNLDLALDLSSKAILNRDVKRKVEEAGRLIKEESVSFVESLDKVGLLSNTMIGLLGMGHTSGSTDSALEYIAELYEDDYQNALMKRVSLIEPISIVIITILIGSILTSVMFPLLGVLSAIG